MSYDFDQPPQGMSDGAKIAIGCGAAAFLCIVLICGGFVLLGFRAVEVAKDAAEEIQAEFAKQQAMHQQQADAFAARFVDQGYHHIDAQILDVSSVVKTPTVYTGQVINLHTDSEASVAVYAQAVDVQGTINGDLHIHCDVLNVHPDTVITGNLYLEETNLVENKGTVQGEIIHQSSSHDGSTDESDDAESELKPSPGDVIETSDEDRPDTTKSAGERGTSNEGAPSSEGSVDDESSAATDAPTDSETDSQSSN